MTKMLLGTLALMPLLASAATPSFDCAKAHSAAEQPSSTKNRVNIQPKLEMRQSQVVVNSSANSDMSLGQACAAVTPKARESGSQNTEKP